MSQSFPPAGQWFISHAYADAAAVDELLSILPSNMRTLRFPPITVSPDAKVSNELIHAIRTSEGLIYLKEGRSAESPWVAFERDYALRSHKPVYAFTPSTRQLTRDASAPAEMLFYLISHRQDEEKVFELVKFMVEERNFANSNFIQVMTNAYDGQQIAADILETAELGGYVLVFWSSTILTDDKWAHGDLLKNWDHFVFRRKALGAYGLLMRLGLQHERYIIVQLDDSPVQPGFAKNLHIKLFGDSSLSSEHYIDQLIVQLCWLMYQDS